MTMEQLNTIIEQYLDRSEADFDRILEAGEKKRHRKVVLWSAVAGTAVAAGIALLLWLAPAREVNPGMMSPVQIAEGIQQMMLLEIGDIDSIVATPYESYAILTARLKDGSTCSYILKFNDELGTPMLLAYNNEQI